MTVDSILKEFNEIKANRPVKYMDWDKAKRLCLAHPNCSIWAGIRGDMGNTGGPIYDHGEWCKGYVYDRSWCGTPILELSYEDSDGEYVEFEIPCWTYEEHESTGLPEWWGA